MPKKRLKFLCFALVALLAFNLSLFGAGKQEQDREQAEEKVLRIALNNSPNTIEPSMGDSRTATNVAWSLFDSLVWLNEEGKVVPALATSWTVSEDGTVYTFELREGVTFHNGNAFTADDVVFTWERGRGEGITYGEDFRVVQEVRKIDDYTVEVILEQPNSMMLMQMNEHWGILSRKYHEEVGEQGYMQHPIGTGPFEFIQWNKGDRIVLEANRNYWQEGYPRLDKVIYRPIQESATRLAALKNNDIDVVSRMSPEEADAVMGNDDIKLISYPKDRVYYIAFNNMTTGVGTPIENKLIRQAMSYAVDYDAIIDNIFNGKAKRVAGFVVPGNLGYDPSVEPYPYDPDKARKLLAEAGYPDGFEIDMDGPSDTYINFEQVMQAVAGYLGEVGIKVNLGFMESGKYWDLESQRKLSPLFGDSWSSSTADSFRRLNGSVGGKDASYAAWYDEKLVGMVEELRLTPDQDERAKVYTRILEYMKEDPPFIYLYQPMAFEATRAHVRDYKPRVSEQIYLKGVSVQ